MNSPIGKVFDTSLVQRTDDNRKVHFVRITSIDENIKNGEPGWDGVYVDIDGKPIISWGAEWRVWGYDSQILWEMKGL